MAVTRREHIFLAFIIGILSILFIVVAIASDSWVAASASADNLIRDNQIRYGLFKGEFELNVLGTPALNSLHMTCIPSLDACAMSCKINPQAREDELRALAQGQRPALGCNADASVTNPAPLDPPPVMSFALYVSVLILLFLQLAMAVVSSGLAIVNATRNPTEPIFGLAGCFWSNCAAAVLGVAVLLSFGIYWEVSSLKDHLAFSDVAQQTYDLNQGLGYSYWLLIAAVVCSLCNMGLLKLRKYLLERDPPPPTIKVENHSDGTIFLY